MTSYTVDWRIGPRKFDAIRSVSGSSISRRLNSAQRRSKFKRTRAIRVAAPSHPTSLLNHDN